MTRFGASKRKTVREQKEHVVHPYNPPSYDWYVDDCLSKKVENEPDRLLERLNNNHHNIKFTVEEKPKHFLDTTFKYQNRTFHRLVYCKPGNVPTHWLSQVLTNWKKKTSIMGALHRAKGVSTNRESDIKKITEIYISKQVIPSVSVKPQSTKYILSLRNFSPRNTEQNQVVCKFQSYNIDDDRTVENVFFFFNLVTFSLLQNKEKND